MSEINYNTLIQEGVWFHKTNENAPSIEVSGVDHHRKIVYIGDMSMSVDVQTMSFDELLRDYQMPSLEHFVSGGKHVSNETDNLLGGLSKEGEEQHQDKIEDDIKNASNVELKSTNEKVEIYKPQFLVDKNTSEYRIITDAMNLSRDSESEYVGEVDVHFSFDIDKVASVAKMFNIEAEKVAEIVLSDSDGVNALKEVFVSILNKVISKG